MPDTMLCYILDIVTEFHVTMQQHRDSCPWPLPGHRQALFAL